MHSRRKPPGLEELRETQPWEWPRNAVRLLKDILRNRTFAASERIEAADFAGNLVVMDDGMATTLLTILRDAAEPAELRAAAAVSMGPALEDAYTNEYEDDISQPAISEKKFFEIQETLRQSYSDESLPKLVRRRILEAAVRAPLDWQTEAIGAAAASPDEDWQLTAAFGMRYIRGFDDQIMRFLDSPNPEIHCEAVGAAGNAGLDRAWPHVSALLTAEGIEKGLLLEAIGAAGEICPEEAGEILAGLALSEDEEIAEAAGEAMSMSRLGLDYDDDDEDHDDFFDEDDDDDDDLSGDAPKPR